MSATLAPTQSTVQLILELEQSGALTPVELRLTDPDMTYERWESLGRFLGRIDRASRWWIGDFLNFGEALFGEQFAQGVEATTKERYSEAERITGLDHGTLMNIRSVCGSIPASRRREELPFWVHAEVAPLEADEQVRWLDLAVQSGWTRSQLRASIRDEKNPHVDPGPDPGPGGAAPLTRTEHLEQASRLVFHQAQKHRSGGYLVPSEAFEQLRAALGEE